MKLAGKGVDLDIHVVGLGVDAATRKQLQCIADKGQGTYHDAKDATQLAEALDRAQGTLLPPTMVNGKPVEGTRTIVGAPSIRVGDWIDDIGPDGSEDGVRFYRLRRTIPGSTMMATAIVHPHAGQQDAVMATLNAGERQCGADTANGHPGGDQMMVSATAVADQRDEDCASATDLVLQVERKGVRDGAGTPPLQIVVSEVPPVVNLDQLPKAPARRTLPAPAFGRGTSVQPGGTLAAAAPIVGGATYEHVLAPGQMHTYKVPVGWGQSLSVQLQSPKPGPQLAKLFREQRMVLDAELFDPAGRKVAEHPIRLTQYGYSSTMQAADVTFNFPEGQPLKHPWVAGHYRVAIGVRGPADAPKVEVPYQFVTKVDGKVQGVPLYGTVTGASPGPSASAAAAPSGESGTPAATAGGSGSDQAGQNDSDQDDAGPKTDPATDESHGISPWPVLLGVLGLILTACGVVLGLARRRRNQPDASSSGNGLAYRTDWKPGGDSSEDR